MSNKPYPTIKAQTTSSSMVKPGELVDIVEMTSLTLADRRIYNQLIEHAWDTIDQPVEHVIAKRKLRGHGANNNFRVGESIERLMGAIVRVKIVKEGKPATRRVQLLGGNDEHDDKDGMLYYEIPAKLRTIIKESTIFARLQKDVMFAFTSKYALALYEMVQKRGNLREKWYEDFTVEQIRGLLGVQSGKLDRFADLNKYAIKPAQKEVNALSDYGVKIEPIKEGRRVVKLRLAWWKKDMHGLKQAWTELQRCKVGRFARIDGTTQTLTPKESNNDGEFAPLVAGVKDNLAALKQQRQQMVKQRNREKRAICQQMIHENQNIALDFFKLVLPDKKTAVYRQMIDDSNNVLENYRNHPSLATQLNLHLMKKYPSRFQEIDEMYNQTLAAIDEKIAVLTAKGKG